MPGRHAILGPSSAYRWLACTPSARFEEQIPEQESEFALEGTLAHELAALILSGRSGIFKGKQKAYNEYLEEIEKRIVEFYYTGTKSTQDAQKAYFHMLEYAEEWASLITEQATEHNGQIFIEQEYDISAYVPLGFGTADATVVSKKVLLVTDLKFGAGVPVTATANKQLMLYGVGALLKAVESGHKPETVILTISQPRAGGTSKWEISVPELLKWAEFEVRPKALLAIAGQGEFVAGSHCLFCKARTNCSAFYKEFEEASYIHDKRVMTNKDLTKVLEKGPTIASWIKKVEQEAIETLQNRKKIPGFKLVAGRGQRQFKNEDDVVEILMSEGCKDEDIFDTKVNSLTSIEETLGKKKFNALFEDYIFNKEGKPQIVLVDDPRPAIGASRADEYDDEEIDDLL